MTTPHLILVPGFWLGAWAWDAVVDALAARGLAATALTLPGLHPHDDRWHVTRADQLAAITDAIDTAEGPVVLVGHSGGGSLVGEAVDRRPDRVARAVYVDSGPLEDGAVIDPTLSADATEIALPDWEELAAQGSSIEGIDEAALAEFRRRAVPEPAAIATEPVRVGDPRRFDVPVTALCHSISSEVLRTMADGGPPFHTELGRYDVTYVDLPTGHWPMFSRPGDLAAALADAASPTPSGG
ncbi:alpha/beta hydrolase [Cellulomonas sp. JH27-2]|uniref:alpha/beta fold hydrolase n=1 Tax=Cellulomonas sp. JH27-2 TaxID=2774139 RepID=UPI0017833C4D|nr:alpha/beta fold hydrolase [Cellulomonas sp. JH27-2]MBD8058176.1 alpha/beta hydrolase [Cellulomonas sp. JH27-2]